MAVINFRVICSRCDGTFIDRKISGSETNPNRPYWKCPRCKYFVWEDDLKDYQKVAVMSEDVSPPSTPRPSQRNRAMMAQAPFGSPSISNKRERERSTSPSPPPYQELCSQGQTSSSQRTFPFSQSQDAAKANRLAMIQQAQSQDQNRSPHDRSDSRVAKAPRLVDASDIHSGSQPGAYLTPPSTLGGSAANYTQQPPMPSTPTQKGKERERGSMIQLGSMHSQSEDTLSSSQSQSGLHISEFETYLVNIKSAYELSERKRVAAERSAHAKATRIQELEDQVKFLEEKLKKIQNAMGS